MSPREIMLRDSSEFLRFENVKQPKSTRPDLHAFLLLDEICPTDSQGVLASADHDEVWLSFDPDLAFVRMTEEQTWDLKRCGVMYDASYNRFQMFV